MIQATLHQLRVFATVAHHGSFTKAAQELMITQPSVSSQVKNLTNTLGFPLFEQIGKQLYLTQAGEELLSTCQVIFQQLDNLEMKIADWSGLKQGKLKLAVVTTAKYFIPRLLGAFCQEYPGIDVALQVINHEEMCKRMEANLDDLYILSQLPEDIDLYSEAFMGNPLVVIARADHPLAKERNIPLKRLQEEPFILREIGSGTREAVRKLFTKNRIEIKVRLELGSNETIKQAIAGGLGLSVLSRHTLVSEIPIQITPDSLPGGDENIRCYNLGEQLTVLDVQNFPIERNWYVAYLNGKNLSVVAQTFWDYLILHCSQYDNLSVK